MTKALFLFVYFLVLPWVVLSSCLAGTIGFTRGYFSRWSDLCRGTPGREIFKPHNWEVKKWLI